MKTTTRCAWAASSPLLQEYHDMEWGVPVRDEHRLFEHIVLQGAQAGLSWLTVLRKRDNYRRAFRGFDPRRVARYGARDVTRLMNDAGLIRNRAKIESAINNARCFLAVQDEFGAFDRYLWQFVNGAPIRHRFTRVSQIPATSRESDAMSRDLRARGFTFVGSTICYALMQAAGLVNDHVTGCFRYAPVGRR